MRLELRPVEEFVPHTEDNCCMFWNPEWQVCAFTISYCAPYVTRQPKSTVEVVRKLVTLFEGTDYAYKDYREIQNKRGGYKVRCRACGWTGYRRGYNDCECYEDWGPYCRPWSPGPGCPSGILWPCPQCSGHGFDWRES